LQYDRASFDYAFGSAQDEEKFQCGTFRWLMPDTISLVLSEVEGRTIELQHHPAPG